jgi:SAM-dependent methyltransferase
MSHSETPHTGSHWRLPAALAITTTVTLSVELLFSRLISVLFMAWDAYWVVAIALLGFGMGGALVAVATARLERIVDDLLPLLMIGIGVCAVLPPLILRPIDPEIGQALGADGLSAIYWFVSLLCMLPFLLASVYIALVFTRGRRQIGRLYFFDLLGSGIGCVAFLAVLELTGAELGLALAGSVAVVASALIAARWTRLRIAAFAAGLLVLAASLVLLSGPSPLKPFVPRELRMVHEYQEDKVELEFQQWNPAGRIDIVSVEGETIELPERARYKILTQDGGAPSILLGFDEPFDQLEFPERNLLGIAYWTRERPSVLVIGPGGGPDLVAALRYDPRRVVAVELNDTTIHVVGERFREFVGGLYQRPEVEVVHDDGRHFVRTTDERFDVIQLTGVDTTVLGSAGALQNLSENYLYTLEAFGDYWDHLTEDGLLSLSYPDYGFWGYRSISMLLKLMSDRGIDEPERHLVISRSGGYVSILAKRAPFTRDEVAEIRAHFEQPMYGLLLPLYFELWGRHMPADGMEFYVNRQFLEQQRVLYDPFQKRRSPHARLIEAFQITGDSPRFWQQVMGGFTPSVDDSPFFMLPIRVGAQFTERLIWLLVPVGLFILLPLLVFRRRGLSIRGSAPLALYFACLGFAFIAVEITLLQKFILFLGHPAQSFAVVLGTLLVTSGIGSLLSGRLASRPLHGIWLGLGGIGVSMALLLLGLAVFGSWLLGTSLPVRSLLAAALLAPLGFFMGTMFPGGIRLLDARADDFVPWAWGINGSLSVIGSISSLFLAIELGFRLLLVIAVLVYVVAALSATWAAWRAAATPAS